MLTLLNRRRATASMQEQMLAIAGVAYKTAILKPGLRPEDRARHGGCGMMERGIWAQKKQLRISQLPLICCSGRGSRSLDLRIMNPTL